MPKGKKTFFGVFRQDNAMWIGMIIFSSVWMFVLGIFVGRGTAPIRFDMKALQKELIELKETVLRKEKERFKAYMATAHKKTDLDFYEALKAPTEPAEIPDTGATKELIEKAILGDERGPHSQTRNDESAAPYAVQIASLKEIKAAEEEGIVVHPSRTFTRLLTSALCQGLLTQR